jgi:hypothetical protein
MKSDCECVGYSRMTGNVRFEDGSSGFSSLISASSRSGVTFVFLVRMFLALSASCRVARLDAANASRSLRALSTEST